MYIVYVVSYHQTWMTMFPKTSPFDLVICQSQLIIWNVDGLPTSRRLSNVRFQVKVSQLWEWINCKFVVFFFITGILAEVIPVIMRKAQIPFEIIFYDRQVEEVCRRNPIWRKMQVFYIFHIVMKFTREYTWRLGNFEINSTFKILTKSKTEVIYCKYNVTFWWFIANRKY